MNVVMEGFDVGIHHEVELPGQWLPRYAWLRDEIIDMDVWYTA